MFNAKVTIGIRTYNVSSYVEECLNSVYNQTIKNDIKVVLVDDCSTDETLIVLDKWLDEHLDFDIEIYTNSQNQGAGVMLMLLQHYIKDTEYVIFLDSDDFYFNYECLEYMYNFIKKHEFDFVKFSVNTDDHHTKTLMKYDIFKQIKFNPFRIVEDHYGQQLFNMTNNWVLHKYDFYYYRNNMNSLVRAGAPKSALSWIFDQIYYKNIKETAVQLKYLIPEKEYIQVYNEMSSIDYEICPAVIVLSRNTDLTEFIEHYYKLGFLLIFVLDNNDEPIQYSNVSIIPYNNVKLINFAEFQSTAYDYALRIIRKTKYNYVLVVDDDEYLELRHHTNIIDFIKDEMLSNGYYNCDFCWETYDDNNIIYEKDVIKNSILTTYTRKLLKGKYDDITRRNWTKSLYRIFPDTNYSRSLNPGHYPNLEYRCNVVNKKIAVLKHYRTQCLETFIRSKVLQKNFNKGNFGASGLLTSYFCINTLSLQKLEAYKELCNKYGIEYDLEEYDKYFNICLSQHNLSVIIPVLNNDEVELVNSMTFPEKCSVYMVTSNDITSTSRHSINKYNINIYDALTHTIKNSDSEYACIIFPNSKIYKDKFSKQLEYLQNNINVDMVTCDYLYKGNLNIKPSISTVMFRVNSMKDLDFILEDYYQSYDKFFINTKDLNTKHINEVLLEESFTSTPCLYNIHNLFNQPISKDLTVIITFLNEGPEIKKTVESIRATTIGIPIILINDFSTDGYDYESLAKIYNCKYIKTNKNFGVAGSRDLGVSICETEYFVLLDGHMRFYEIDWDLKLIELLLEKPNSIICSNTSAITSYLDLGYITEQKFQSTTYAGYIDLTKRMYDYKWSFKALDSGEVTRVACVIGACYASTKTHWNHIRGLQGLIKYGCDEQLMSIKTWLSGGECLLLKNFYTGHLYRTKSPYYVSDNHVLTNQIILAYFFDYGLEQIELQTDSILYNKCLQNINFETLNKIKYDFNNNVQKYLFDYFLKLNNCINNNSQ